jgi:hypothetical protein
MAFAQPHPIDDDDDAHLVVHQYIRLFGRRPTAQELAQYRAARSRVRYRMGSRLRRRVATLVTRL